jgi:hypothetical protein
MKTNEKKTNQKLIKTFTKILVKFESVEDESSKIDLSIRKHGQEMVYLQQPLNDTVGPEIFADFRQLGWDKLDFIQVRFLL